MTDRDEPLTIDEELDQRSFGEWVEGLNGETVPSPTSPVGICDVPEADYHADPCPQPSLSASLIHILCTRSPKHAWAAHPRLNPNFKREEKDQFDIGTVAHAMLLEGRSAVEVIHAPNWRTNAAKEAREEARANGRVPLLAHAAADVEAMVEAAKRELAARNIQPPLFTDGQPEKTLVWHEGDIACRARLDWLRDDLATIDDYKTSHNAAPDQWTRKSIYQHGYDVKAAFYLRGLERLTGVRAEFRWVAQEKEPPYELIVVSPGPDVLTLAERKVDYALELWKRCLESGEWPGYPQRLCWAELPPWEEARWLEREMREAA